MSDREQLVVDIKHSRQLIFLLFTIHGLAVFSLVSIPVPLLLTVVVMALIAVSLKYYIGRVHNVVRIIMRPDNEWLIEKHNGIIINASLAGNTYISDNLMLLVFRSSEKILPTYVYLTEESVKESTMSQLKLSLKISD